MYFIPVENVFPQWPICQHCHELIFPRERLAPIQNAFVHHECGFRMVAGSVGHQKHQCSCYGKEDTSEVGLTLRQAAKASLEYYLSARQLNANGPPNIGGPFINY